MHDILTLCAGSVRIRSYSKCPNSVRIRSYPGPYFPAFELNTERYFVSLCIQSEYGKIQTRITPNTDTFHSVRVFTQRSEARYLRCIDYMRRELIFKLRRVLKQRFEIDNFNCARTPQYIHLHQKQQ